MSLDEALARVLADKIEPQEMAAESFKCVMHSFLTKLLFALRNDSYFGSLLNVGSEPSRLHETGLDRFEAKIVLKNLWRLVGLNLEIELAEGGTVALAPKRAVGIESRMVLARVQHPLYDVIRPADVIVLFAHAVSTAVPKMKFTHKSMHGVPRVVMSGATVTLFVDFNGQPMRLELLPVFQFPWAFLPAELKESRNLKMHQAKHGESSVHWSAVPQQDTHQMTWAIEFHGLENEFRKANCANDAMRLILGILKSVQLDLPHRLVLQALLWLDEERGPAFWSAGLGVVVVEALDFLRLALHHAKLSNFWIDGHELLGAEDADTRAAAAQLQAVLAVVKGPDVAEAVGALFA